ncbi:MAG: hypothetical protein Kow0090_02550 [Myxococcota bacterium]
MKRSFAFAALLIAHTSFAYILPGDFLIGKLSEWRQNLKIDALKLESEWTIFPKGSDPAAYSVKEYLRAPYERRIELESEKGTEITIWRGIDKWAKATGEKKWTKEKDKLPIEAVLFTGAPEPKTLLSTIKRLGVDIEKRRLDRLDGKVGFVIGAEKKGEKANELWLDRRTFKPMRFIAFEEKGGKLYETDMRFSDYTSSVSGEWHPRMIEKYLNGALVERRELIDIKVNPNNLDPKLFTPE